MRDLRAERGDGDPMATGPADVQLTLPHVWGKDDLMDALTLLVLAETQPRAKVRDNRPQFHSKILCVSHVVETNARHYDFDDKPGPQGHCAVCGKALRRPRMT